MNLLLRKLLTRYQAPAKGEGEDLPGAEDYGDDFTPTDDGADVAADRAPTGAGADDADPAPGDKDEPGKDGEAGQCFLQLPDHVRNTDSSGGKIRQGRS